MVFVQFISIDNIGNSTSFLNLSYTCLKVVNINWKIVKSDKKMSFFLTFLFHPRFFRCHPCQLSLLEKKQEILKYENSFSENVLEKTV